MTPERARELLPIIQARGEGEEIEYQRHDGVWVSNENMDISGEWKYRIKPEPLWYEHIIAAATTYFRKATNVSFEAPSEGTSNAVHIYIPNRQGVKALRGIISLCTPCGVMVQHYYTEWYGFVMSGGTFQTKTERDVDLTTILDWISERLDEEEIPLKWPKELADHLTRFFKTEEPINPVISVHHIDSKPSVTVASVGRIATVMLVDHFYDILFNDGWPTLKSIPNPTAVGLHIREWFHKRPLKWYDELYAELVKYFCRTELNVSIDRHPDRNTVTIVCGQRLFTISEAVRSYHQVILTGGKGWENFKTISDDRICQDIHDWIHEDDLAKKKPVVVPWGPDDVPLVCWIRHVAPANPLVRDLISNVNMHGVNLGSSKGELTYKSLFEHYEYISPSTNPTEWKPCRKEVLQ